MTLSPQYTELGISLIGAGDITLNRRENVLGPTSETFRELRREDLESIESMTIASPIEEGAIHAP